MKIKIGIKAYLVGGAVRDKLLGLSVKERDWVVVGSSPHEMLSLGFNKVGRDFPVFLHPKTHEEYALARTERKIGKGYTGFACYFDPSVTLEDDLKRRDLTINAIAQDKNGDIIDPYGGRRDLKKHILRHVSPAFAEDPVRILRLARFAARFSDFKVHRETNKLMQTMLAKGEVDALIPERVWQEFNKALGEESPERFFIVLKKCGVLQKLFPEIFLHFTAIKKVLMRSVKLSENIIVRFAAIAFNLDQLDQAGAIKHFCKKHRAPNAYTELALLAAQFKNKFQKIPESADNYISLLEQVDSYRRPERLQQFLYVLIANNIITISIANRISLIYRLTKKIKLTSKIIAENNKQDLHQILHDKRKKQIEPRFN